jgi:hypothetical protein
VGERVGGRGDDRRPVGEPGDVLLGGRLRRDLERGADLAGVLDPLLEGGLQIAQQVLGRHRDEPGRFAAEPPGGAARHEFAQRLVHLRLRHPGALGHRVPGLRFGREQADVAARLVLGEAQRQQRLSEPLGR